MVGFGVVEDGPGRQRKAWVMDMPSAFFVSYQVLARQPSMQIWVTAIRCSAERVE